MKKLVIYLSLIIICYSLNAQDQITNNGNFQIHSGASVSIFGDLANNGTLNTGTGTIIFKGNNAQSIKGTVEPTFYNLTINNTSSTGITLNGGNVTISHLLTLTDGNIYSSSDNLLVIADDVSVSGTSASSFVDGPVQKIGNEVFTFPVGQSSCYQSITMSAPSLVTDAFIVEYFNGNPNLAYGSTLDPALNWISPTDYWTVNRINGSSNLTITLGWNNYCSSGVSILGDLRVARWNGALWEDKGNASVSGNSASGSVTALLISDILGAFTLGSITIQTPVPIQLLEFTAEENVDKVDLKWKTATEINNDFFTIERTKDGSNFEEIAIVDGAGSSFIELNYSTIDKYPFNGISYYRLKQTDFNGESTYSKLQAVNFKGNSDLLFDVYPNPNNGESIFIDISADKDKEVLVVLTDIFGNESYSKVIVTDESGNRVFAINPSKRLIPGVYVVSASSNQKIYGKRMVVQ